MNRFKTFLLMFAITVLSVNSAFSASLDSLIKKSDIDKTSTVAVSVKDAKTGRVVYAYNEHKLMNPASVQKIFTMKAAYNALKPEYTFDTSVYTDKHNNLYLKLGADPSLTTGDLKKLFANAKENHKKSVKDIVIDPSIIDNTQWGTGWMWDDDTNALLPKYTPFSVNENKINIEIIPGANGRNPEIKNKSSYPMVFVNLTRNGLSNDVSFERTPWVSGDMTYVYGTIKSQVNRKMPVDSVQTYFNIELAKALTSSGIKYSGQIKVAPTPKNAQKIASISSAPLNELMSGTLKNSNNFYSEMIFKTAGGHYTNSQGSTAKAIEMFNKYFSTIKSDKPLIADGCGISRNNLMSADWTTEALNYISRDSDFNQFVVLLPKPIEGTLSDRLLNISLQLRAKTGTASGISSIAGYIDTKSGKKYSFAIFIQNHNSDATKIKKFEDSLINEIYKM